MARTSKWAWLAAGALALAACGGSGDDANPDDGTAPPADGAEQPTDGGEAGTAEPDPVSDDGGTGEATGDVAVDEPAAGFGPALTPTETFVIPTSAAPSTNGIAVSPSGDRIAVMWIAESDFSTNLAIYDVAGGSELVSITDDRLDGGVFWTADDRIVTIGNSAVAHEWDSTTLAPVGDAPLSEGAPGCGGGNGTVFDPVAGVVFLKSDSLCRLDLATGAATQYEATAPTTLLAVAIGGNEVYLRGTDDAGELVLRVLDATTLSVVSDEPSDGPNPVVAASGNGAIEQEDGGFGYIVQPSGRVVDFYPNGITTSAAGGYYVGGFDGGLVIVASGDGTSIGTVAGVATARAWSADDSVFAVHTADGVSIYALP